jgi:hypothetical protein
MKTKITLSTLFGFFLLFSVHTALTSGTGAPQGHTGSPGDGANCTACHSGSPTTLTGLITSNIPASGYVPGSTYLITATITHPTFNKFGFQISPQNSSGTLMGTLALTMPSATQILNGKWITHTGSGTAGTSNSRTWTFNWTAPSSGGAVTFYGAFNCANGDNNTTGDQIRLSSLTVQQAAAPLSIASFPSNPSCAGPCNGGASISVSGGTPPYSILWSTGATGQAISGLCAGSYSVVVTDNTGNTANTTISLTSPPPASASINVVGATALCSGDCATLQLPGTFSNYTWSNGASTPQIVVCNSGAYSVTATSASGCITVSNTVNITTLPSPGTPTISDNNNVLSSTPAFAYQWLLNGITITGATQQNHTAIQNGDYRVVVTNVEGCSDTSTVYTVSSISLEESTSAVVSAFPNPFNNSLYFSERGYARITDLSGRVVFEGTVAEKIEIETKDWPSGMYIVEFTDSGSQKRYFRLVKP